MWDKLAPLRMWLTHNKGFKALSFLMAVICWYMISDAIRFEVVIPDIRLLIQTPPGLAILNQSAGTVDVTFRGSQDDLERLDPRQADQQLRGVVSLPAGTGKTVRILVFAEGDAARQASEAAVEEVDPAVPGRLGGGGEWAEESREGQERKESGGSGHGVVLSARSRKLTPAAALFPDFANGPPRCC